jgi:hypothetical protein
VTLRQFYTVLGKCLKHTPEARIGLHRDTIRIYLDGIPSDPLAFVPRCYGKGVLRSIEEAAHYLQLPLSVALQVAAASDSRFTSYGDIRKNLKRVVSRFKVVGEL